MAARELCSGRGTGAWAIHRPDSGVSPRASCACSVSRVRPRSARPFARLCLRHCIRPPPPPPPPDDDGTHWKNREDSEGLSRPRGCWQPAALLHADVACRTPEPSDPLAVRTTLRSLIRTPNESSAPFSFPSPTRLTAVVVIVERCSCVDALFLAEIASQSSLPLRRNPPLHTPHASKHWWSQQTRPGSMQRASTP